MSNRSFKKTDFLSYGGPIAHTARWTSFLQWAVSIPCQRSNGRICVNLGWEMFVSRHILMLVPFKEAIRSVMVREQQWVGRGEGGFPLNTPEVKLWIPLTRCFLLTQTSQKLR